jgi:8-oxo-dGTP pyrophosphatase MutT (NUDIX family)
MCPMSKQEERHKAIAIPVTYSNGNPRFLTVKDRRFKEWIFVTGGCRRREVYNPLQCALRELEEETRGVVKLKKGSYSSFVFTCSNHPEDEEHGVDVTLVYHVFIFEVNLTRIQQMNMIERFDKERARTDERKRLKLPIRRTFDENAEMCFDTLEEFNRKVRWDFIVKNVIDNPDFSTALNSLNRKTFSIY